MPLRLEHRGSHERRASAHGARASAASPASPGRYALSCGLEPESPIPFLLMKMIFLDIDGVLNCDKTPNPREFP